jgi:hypothetical protein
MTLETLVKLLKMRKFNKINEQIIIHLVPEIKGLNIKIQTQKLAQNMLWARTV